MWGTTCGYRPRTGEKYLTYTWCSAGMRFSVFGRVDGFEGAEEGVDMMKHPCDSLSRNFVLYLLGISGICCFLKAMSNQPWHTCMKLYSKVAFWRKSIVLDPIISDKVEIYAICLRACDLQGPCLSYRVLPAPIIKPDFCVHHKTRHD